MTDLDRLKKSAAAASTGLPPPTNDERRFLLKQIISLAEYNASYALTTGAAERWLRLIDSCRYTDPPKRCPTCDGDTGWMDCQSCHGTGYQEPVT